jgi:hypothetical protein
MNLMDVAQLLGNFGEFFGAMAVVATLIYLAVQVRHSKEAVEAQTQAHRFDQMMTFAEEIMGNPPLAAAITKLENDEQLDATEEMLVRAMALRTLRQLEWQFNEQRAGRLSSSLPLTTFRKGFRSDGIFRWPLGKYWIEMKDFFTADFVDFVEQNIVAATSE